MALGTSNISTAVVNTAIGSPYGTPRLVSQLCTHANVNEWARYGPGYMYPLTGADKFLDYQAPQGAAYTDPRGINPDTGNDEEEYRLGDFRGYDHTSIAAYVNFPTGTVQFPNGTSTSSGISRTLYAEDIDWENDGIYRETHDWVGPITHVHMLDADDDSMAGSGLLPAVGGNVNIPLDGVSLPVGIEQTVTYHVAFGVDATHWSFKLGTNNGAGGIGDVKMIQLEAPEVLGVNWDDDDFTGGANDPYDDVVIWDTTNTNRFSGNTVIWDYSQLDGLRCHYSAGGGGTDDYRNISATWYIKGFIENSATEYEVKTTAFASNGANNTVDLASMVDSPPRGYWKDGDKMTLILRVLTINY